MDEEVFLSRDFATALAIVNLSLLGSFLITHWTKPSGLSVISLVSRVFKPLPPKIQQQISLRITPPFIMTTILSSLIIGLLCARSLHYQFYAYIAWSTPFLLWRSGLHPVAIYAVWAAQEWAWNVYPSTNSSSVVVVGCLATQVFGVWWGTRNEMAKEEAPTEREEVVDSRIK